jgi:putative SOS response-associated peptidase YedK
MPVILDPADHDEWLTGTPDEATELIKPYPADQLHIAMEGGKSDNMRQAVTLGWY